MKLCVVALVVIMDFRERGIEALVFVDAMNPRIFGLDS